MAHDRKIGPRRRFGDVALALALIVGAGLLSYPSISDLWNRSRSSKAVSAYTEVVDGLQKQEKQEMLDAAASYNSDLVSDPGRFVRKPEGGKGYQDLLNVNGNGMMGYVVIPSIGVELPIQHGVSADTLQVAAGHIPGSSLPVGGDGTHCVISAHRGLPSAKLFTDLDELNEGDLFSLHVLGEEFWYEVDQIRTVLPEEVEGLSIEKDSDYCTLVTCTPYSINTHRLLVRGHRVEPSESMEAEADAVLMRTWKEALFIMIPVLLAIFLWVVSRPRRRGDDFEDDL